MNGKFERMPEFGDAKNFPRDCDDLHGVSLVEWKKFPFVSLSPSFKLDGVLDVLEQPHGFPTARAVPLCAGIFKGVPGECKTGVFVLRQLPGRFFTFHLFITRPEQSARL
jgi:choline monooxygenase